jgi:hypothetical protein
MLMKIRFTAVILAAAFCVAVATLSVASVAGPVAAAHAEDNGDDKLDQDDCDQLEQTFNGAVETGHNERVAGRWGGWNLMQQIAEETYLDAAEGGCEWAAEAAAPTGGVLVSPTQAAGGYALQQSEPVADSGQVFGTWRDRQVEIQLAEDFGASSEQSEPTYFTARCTRCAGGE